MLKKILYIVMLFVVSIGIVATNLLIGQTQGKEKKVAVFNEEIFKKFNIDGNNAWLWIPKGARKDSPIIFYIHGMNGWGGDQAEYRIRTVWKAYAKTKNFIVIAPTMPQKSLPYWRVDDYTFIMDSLNIIIKKERLNNNKVYLLGFSQGSEVALDIYKSNKNRFAGMVILAGGIYAKSSVEGIDIPLFVGVGQYDPNVELMSNAMRKLSTYDCGYEVFSESIENDISMDKSINGEDSKFSTIATTLRDKIMPTETNEEDIEPLIKRKDISFCVYKNLGHDFSETEVNNILFWIITKDKQ